MHGIGFVRGTDSSLAPVPAGSVTTELMHTTDWLPTLVNLAGGDVSGSALPLDGHDQWPTIAHGKPTSRKFIIHNVPITADPVLLPPDPEVCLFKHMSAVYHWTSVSSLTAAADDATGQRWRLQHKCLPLKRRQPNRSLPWCVRACVRARARACVCVLDSFLVRGRFRDYGWRYPIG